jgi:hypothetical protein
VFIAFRTEMVALGKHERPVMVMENRWREAGNPPGPSHQKIVLEFFDSFIVCKLME